MTRTANYSGNLFNAGFREPPNVMTTPTTDNNRVLFIYLMTHDYIFRDTLGRLGVNNMSKKIETINRGGKFILTPDDGGYFIEKISPLS